MPGEPQNLVLSLLREIRAEMRAHATDVDKQFADVRTRLEGVDKKLDSLRQAVNGESVLGRYAAAEV